MVKFARLGNTEFMALSGIPNHEHNVAGQAEASPVRPAPRSLLVKCRLAYLALANSPAADSSFPAAKALVAALSMM